MLRGGEVRRRVDGRALVLEDPVIDSARVAEGTHEVLQREGETDRRLVPHDVGGNAGGLGLGHQVFELGDRLRWLGHADLGGQRLVVENAGHRIVEAHGIERAFAARAAAVGDAVLRELRRRIFVPAESRRVAVEILEQAVFYQIADRRQSDQVGRIVTGQHARAVLHQRREQIFLDIESDVRELLGELLGELGR